jgi:hypothetical protein
MQQMVARLVDTQMTVLTRVIELTTMVRGQDIQEPRYHQ